MKSLRFLPLCIAAAFACVADPIGSVAGQWSLTESLNSQSGISCELTGELLLGANSDGSLFTGLRTISAQTCTGAPEGFNLIRGSSVFRGEVSGNRVTFMADVCSFEGTLNGDTMNGTSSCPDGLSGQLTEFAGTWRADRLPQS